MISNVEEETIKSILAACLGQNEIGEGELVFSMKLLSSLYRSAVGKNAFVSRVFFVTVSEGDGINNIKINVRSIIVTPGVSREKVEEYIRSIPGFEEGSNVFAIKPQLDDIFEHGERLMKESIS